NLRKLINEHDDGGQRKSFVLGFCLDERMLGGTGCCGVGLEILGQHRTTTYDLFFDKPAKHVRGVGMSQLDLRETTGQELRSYDVDVVVFTLTVYHSELHITL